MARTTHTVTNQTPPLVGYDVFTADRVLTEAVERHTAPGLLDEVRGDLSALGRAAGSAQVQEWGAHAAPKPPGQRPHDP
jgi:putative acyl-CoA dehydrogenase